MGKGVPIILFHASTANATPPTLQNGEVALDALADPPHLWTNGPSGLIDLIEGIDVLPIANGGTGATTAAGAVTNLGGPWLPVNNPTFTGVLTGPAIRGNAPFDEFTITASTMY